MRTEIPVYCKHSFLIIYRSIGLKKITPFIRSLGYIPLNQQLALLMHFLFYHYFCIFEITLAGLE